MVSRKNPRFAPGQTIGSMVKSQGVAVNLPLAGQPVPVPVKRLVWVVNLRINGRLQLDSANLFTSFVTSEDTSSPAAFSFPVECAEKIIHAQTFLLRALSRQK